MRSVDLLGLIAFVSLMPDESNPSQSFPERRARTSEISRMTRKGWEDADENGQVRRSQRPERERRPVAHYSRKCEFW